MAALLSVKTLPASGVPHSFIFIYIKSKMLHVTLRILTLDV